MQPRMRGMAMAGALALAGGAGWAGGAEVPALREAAIARVEDGRTLWLDPRSAAPLRVRLAWIAAPAAPHDAEARQHLEIWKGQPVEFRAVGTDRDGAALVEILWRPTAESVVTLNYEMARSGFARADCALSGQYALQCRVLRRAEEVARQERRGMWASGP